MKKVMLVFGTRPEAIKMCPLYLELKKLRGLQTLCLVTAQHREMLDNILGTFAVSPDYDMDIMSGSQTVSTVTQRVLSRLDAILVVEKPDLVLVHGDTTTAFSAGLACFYQKIPVGHVEAGMRSFDRYSPYPEEMNRKLLACLASLHFAPTAANRENLLGEGVDEKTIFVTGNTVIDALRMISERKLGDCAIPEVDFARRRVVLLTCHRRESFGETMLGVFSAVGQILDDYPDVEVVFPIHKNPRVRELFASARIDSDRLHLIEPVNYPAFTGLMRNSYLIVTDSGGIQEEAPYFGKPVVVVREVTERMEAVRAGTVILAGTGRERVLESIASLLDDGQKYNAMSRAINPYGDGFACARIVSAIERYFVPAGAEPDE